MQLLAGVGWTSIPWLHRLRQPTLSQYPTGTIYLARDNVTTHEDDEVEAIVRASESIPYLPDVPLNKLHIPKETPCERLPEIHVTSFIYTCIEYNNLY
jgi:hypothetical protein